MRRGGARRMLVRSSNQGGAMRHPLSTPAASGSEQLTAARPLAVGDVDRLVVGDAPSEAVPEQPEPAVAERAQSGVVSVPLRPLPVVEGARPGRAPQAAEGPLLDRVGEVAVVGEAAGDDELALPRAPRDGGLAPVALERVRRLELRGMVADLAGDPGGEAITEARKAQVDLAVREAFAQLVRPRRLAATAARRPEQELAHPPLPGPALLADRDERAGGAAGALGLCA